MKHLLFLLFALTAHAQVIDGKFPVVSNLKAGAAKVDITPSDVSGITVIGHRREVTGVRDPLRAGVLILDDGETKAAIVTMDTIGAWEEMVKLARAGIEKETGVPAANIIKIRCPLVTSDSNIDGVDLATQSVVLWYGCLKCLHCVFVVNIVVFLDSVHN